MTSNRFTASLLAVSAVVAAALTSGDARAMEPVHFQLSWLPTGDYAAYSAGIEKGFYKELGLDLSMSTGRGSGDAVKKIAGRASPFGDSDISAVMTARVVENVPVKCIMAQHTISPHALFVLEGAGINSLRDIEGKSLATTIGNSHFLFFPVLAKLNGIDPSAVKWVNADAAALAPMLLNGKVDGATFFATHHYYQNKEAGKHGKAIKAIPFSDYGFKIYSYCLIAHEETIRTKPQLVQRFIAASQRSFLWAKDTIEEAARIHNRRYPDVAVDDAAGNMRLQFRYMFNEITEKDGFGSYDMKRLEDTYRVVAESQGLDKTISPASFVDTSLLPPK